MFLKSFYYINFFFYKVQDKIFFKNFFYYYK